MAFDDGLRETLNSADNRFIVVMPSSKLGSDGWDVVNAWAQETKRTFSNVEDAKEYAHKIGVRSSGTYDYVLTVEEPDSSYWDDEA